MSITVKYGKYSRVKFPDFVYVYYVRKNILPLKVVTFSPHNTNIYRACKLHRAMFSVFYKILQPKFAFSLISRCSFKLW